MQHIMLILPCIYTFKKILLTSLVKEKTILTNRICYFGCLQLAITFLALSVLLISSHLSFFVLALYGQHISVAKYYIMQKPAGAALILASTQAFILSCMDVRMDALLTANIILAIWQLLEAATAKKWYNTLFAALFMALAFSTKGLVGIIMPCVAILFYLLYRRDFKQLFHPHWIITAICTAIFIIPVVYCYYLQYDLHPEKNNTGHDECIRRKIYFMESEY